MREPDIRPVEPPGGLWSIERYVDRNPPAAPSWLDTLRPNGTLPIPPERLQAAQRAAERAGRESRTDWQSATEAAVLRLAGSQPDVPWLMETLRDMLEGAGTVPPAPDERAWGSVAASLARKGLIVRVAYAKAHDGSPKSLWRLV